jgi:hypothetical protein
MKKDCMHSTHGFIECHLLLCHFQYALIPYMSTMNAHFPLSSTLRISVVSKFVSRLTFIDLFFKKADDDVNDVM